MDFPAHPIDALLDTDLENLETKSTPWALPCFSNISDQFWQLNIHLFKWSPASTTCHSTGKTFFCVWIVDLLIWSQSLHFHVVSHTYKEEHGHWRTQMTYSDLQVRKCHQSNLYSAYGCTLDTTMFTKDGHLITDLFVKPTDYNNLLRYERQHPHGKIKSLPFSQKR